MANGVMRAWDGVAWQSLPAAAPNPGSIAQAVNVNFTPAGTIAASNVQAAVEEVASEANAAIALRATLAQLAASSGTSLLGHIRAEAGASATTSQNKFRRYLDVKDFGAVGDGTTDDTSAFAACFLALNNTTVADIYIPPGSYRITAPIGISNKRVNIRGAGRGLSIIKGEVLSGNLLSIVNADYLQFVTVEDLTFTTNQVNSVVGLYIEYSVADATNNRTFDRCTVRNCSFQPSNPGLTGWQHGIRMNNVHAATLQDIDIMGSTYAAGMTAGVELFSSSTGAPSDVTFNNVKVYYSLIGFKGTGHLEGINFNQCFAIACAVGWDFRLSADFPWFSLTNSHANVTSQGVHLENFSQSFINHNLIYILNHGAGSTPVGISLKACNDTIIDANNIVNPVALGGTTVVGIFTEDCQRAKVANNKVAGYNVAYWLAGTTDFQRTYDNETSSGYGGSIKYNMAASGGSNVQRDTA